MKRTSTTRFAGEDAHATRRGYSWGTAPGTFILMYKPNHDELAQV